MLTRRFICAVVVAAGSLMAAVAQAAPQMTWVEAFESSPAAYGVNASEAWSQEAATRLTTVTGTVRFQLTVSVAGSQLRLRLSNETGAKSLRIGAATVALTTGSDGATTSRVVPLTFGGRPAATIPPGAPLLSDPVALAVTRNASLLVSVYLPEGVEFDALGATGMWIAPGDQTQAAVLAGSSLIIGRPLVGGASVLTAKRVPVVVTLGDSITAGGRKTAGETHGWPETLAQNLPDMAVVNAGIAGNRVISDGYGQSALARLDRDVLRVDGLSDVIVLEGINDIGFPGRFQFGITQSDIDLEALIAGYRQIISRIHARGAKAIGATLLPFDGAFYFTPAKEQMRQAVNLWIRTSGAYDAVVDFDARMRDPDQPSRLRPEFDSGDHLHPNPAGLKAMGDVINPKGLP